jgi:hypothetical protein
MYVFAQRNSEHRRAQGCGLCGGTRDLHSWCGITNAQFSLHHHCSLKINPPGFCRVNFFLASARRRGNSAVSF